MIQKNYIKGRKRKITAAVAVLLMGSLWGKNGIEIPGMGLTTMAESADTGQAAEQEEDWLLIEDDGEMLVDNSGADLEEMKAKERREAEAAAESEAAAKALAEAMAESEQWLESAYPANLQQHLDILTEMDSPTGSDGELIYAEYITKIMEQYGYTISEQPFHEGFINENGVDAPGLNIIAERGADGEERTDDIFIIATHYDSKTNSDPEDPFANDKSGTAALLEMARILACVETDTDICFVFFSGEEDGLYGSTRFVEFMEEDFAHRISGVLYVELVGYAPEYSYLLKTVDGQENSVGNLIKESELTASLLQLAEEENETEEFPKMMGENWIWTEDQETSQYSFAQAGITAVTVSQDIYGEYNQQEIAEGEDPSVSETGSEEKDEPCDIYVDVDKLADITDILAVCVAEVMS